MEEEKTHIPISIGTLTGINTHVQCTVENYVPPTNSDTPVSVNPIHYFCLKTLIRNNLGSIEIGDTINKLVVHDLYIHMMSELTVLITILKDVGVECIIYDLDSGKYYDRISKSMRVKTGKSLLKDLITDEVLKKMLKNNDLNIMKEGYKFKFKNIGNGMNRTVYITTHLPHELFNNSDLYLVRSHTGQVKKVQDINGMLYNGINRLEAEVKLLPFSDILYLIMGDKNIIKPLKLNTRVQIVKIAKKRKWSKYTSRLKILEDIALFTDVDVPGYNKNIPNLF